MGKYSWQQTDLEVRDQRSEVRGQAIQVPSSKFTVKSQEWTIPTAYRLPFTFHWLPNAMRSAMREER